MHLLDINVLIAMADPDHVHHHLVEDFLHKSGRDGWATCPLVENGFIRIFGHPKYPQGPGSTQSARIVLSGLLARAGHQFWADDISIADSAVYQNLPASRDLTDYYLLALAIHHQARLATLDQRIDPSLLPKGPQAFHWLGQ
jgi:toxin-antitoxin system PIN domain toxin